MSNPSVHDVTLDNGLRVVVQPTPAPVAAVYLWFDVGARDETPDEVGVAHFLEHMVFKGTANRGIGACAAEIEGLGGDLNAFTSYDMTVLHATVEASAYEQALDVLADMARNPTIDPEEFEREQLVVLEEIRSYDDDPDTVLSDWMQATLFGPHPYARPVLGTAESVAAITPEQMRAFWKRGYRPDRCVLGVAGNVDPAEVEAAAHRLLGDWTAPTPPRTQAPTASSSEPVRARLEREFESTLVELAWPGPPLGHPDLAAIDVLLGVVGQGAASLLRTRLQLEEAVASEIWASMWSRPLGGCISMGFMPTTGQTGDAIEMTLTVLEEVVRSGLPGSAVARARAAILADYLFAGETVDTHAHDLCWYAALYGDVAERERYREQIAAVTAADVRRVARKWLRPELASVGVIDADMDDAELAKAIAPATRPPVRTEPSREPTKHLLPNGATVWVLPEDSPVAAIRVVALGGALAEVKRRAGMTNAWARMIGNGTQDLDAIEFSEEIDALAGGIGGIGGRNTVGLYGSFPAANALEGIELIGDLVTRPRFDPIDWERVREELTDDVRTVSDRPYQVASMRMWRLLWKDHPWMLPTLGSLTSLDTITTRSLRAWHDSLFTADNLVVAVVGGVEVDAVLESLAWTEDLPKGPYGLDARPAPAALPVGRHTTRAGREQAYVTLSTRGVAFTDPDNKALELAAAILGAQSGRLFLDLREERGLAYSVWASSIEGLDGGVFSAGLATDPRRKTEAARALRASLEQMAAAPPSAEELDRNRRMLVGQAAMALQRTAGRAGMVAVAERYGLPWGLETYKAQLGRVEPTDVSRALQRVLDRGLVELQVRPLA